MERAERKCSSCGKRETEDWTEIWEKEDCGRLGTNNELSVLAAGAAISDGQ